MKNILFCSSLLFMALPVHACVDSGAAQPDNPAESDASALAVARLSDTHAVEFRELEPGLVALVEVGSVDERDEPVDLSEILRRPLPEAFSYLAPGEPIPAALINAEDRRAARISQRDSTADAAPPEPVALGHDQQRVELRRAWEANPEARSAGALLGTASLAVEWDWTGDARWFEQNFCERSTVDSSWCPTNVGWAWTGWRETMYFDTTLMNADFSANASAKVETWNCNGGCSWKIFANETIAPRYWRRFWFETVGWYRSSLSGARVHLTERFRKATPPFTAISDYPFDRSFEAGNDLQGVTHDASNWYFTNAKLAWPNPTRSHIWRVPVGADLNASPTIYNNPWHGVYNHFGDIVHVSGKIYVPLETGGGSGTGSAIGVFNTALQYYGYAVLPGPQGGSCPWIAYNPKDSLFYSSSFDTSYIDKYEITVGSSVSITHRGRFELRDGNGNPTPLTRVQGGKFSSSGKLYLSQDVQGGGIVVVDPYNGRIQKRIPVVFDKNGEDEELEGLDIWDLDDGRAPGVRGHVHVLMIQNEDLSNDDWYFKHFRVFGPEDL
ncbi:hypothetical protein WMF26_32020 [Sorangium sp. So ce185]|uniref:hypothetical protein n=1 Tax=Sorangium sp. So ce185 TaxID=3133287 RepID=UPI003F62983E